MSQVHEAVDRFLVHAAEAKALECAFARGLIDIWVAGEASAEAIASRIGTERAGIEALMAVLTGAGVLDRDTLTPAFREALQYRDLLDAKLGFGALFLQDIAAHADALFCDLPTFMERARTFDLFRYDRAGSSTPAAIEATRRWVELTTILTRYEAPIALAAFDALRFDAIIDIGGNSGEFALALRRASPQARIGVFDLPAVCAIGREHVRSRASEPRIGFTAGDLRRDPLPGGHDLAVFKSVLHDWPTEALGHLLGAARGALASGGQLLIIERTPIDPARTRMTYSLLPTLVFAPFYRPAHVYERALDEAGYTDVNVAQVMVETPFHVITATAP